MTALNLGQPDRVPIVEFTIDRDVAGRICPGCDYAELIDQLGLDMAVVTPDKRGMKRVGEDLYEDDWKTRYKDTGETALIETVFPVSSIEDLRCLAPPDARNDHRLRELRSLVGRFKGQKAIAFTISDAFSIPRKLLGMETLLLSYLDSPELVMEVSAIAVTHSLRLLELAIEAGAEIIFSADDYAWNQGPIMSPAHFERYIYPGLKRLVTRAHELGAKYIKHTDGDISTILDLIVDTGVDGLHPIDPSAGMDICEVKARYGRGLCVIGNVDCHHTLCEGSEKDVEDEVKGLIDRLAPGGGYMIASSNSIHSGVRPGNYLAMIRAARMYGAYPLQSQEKS